MVHVAGSDKRPAEPYEAAAGEMKLMVDDPLEAEHRSAKKRCKSGSRSRSKKDSEYNILDEPSPLGLRLKKSPSLMDLIETAINEAKKEEPEPDVIAFGTSDRIKAANFSIYVLRIGSWERTSQFENDLVAKCYFAKHKLVWEVLEGGLKNKIEIQWDDIASLKATNQGNKLGTWEIMLTRPPLFFRETEPQPRKHTLWQPTQDFTDGQASIHRKHILQCSQSTLSRNFEKLIQCDRRLYTLSQQPQSFLDCVYFEPQYTLLQNQDDSGRQGHLDYKKDDCGSLYPAAAKSNDSNVVLGSTGNRSDFSSRDTTSPSSGFEAEASGGGYSIRDPERNIQSWDQFKVLGLRGNMSMTDLLNHHIPEQMTSDNLSLHAGALASKEVFEDVSQYLLNDSEIYTGPDEQIMVSKVDSFCSLIQKGPGAIALPGIQAHEDKVEQHDVGSEDDLNSTRDNEPFNLKSSLTRDDSVVELLVLPRVASLPKLFNAFGDA